MGDCVDVLRGKVYPRSQITGKFTYFLTLCPSHVTAFYTKFYSEKAFYYGFEEGEAKTSPWVTIKKKMGLKKANKVKESFDQDKKNFSWQQAIKVCGTTSPMPRQQRNSSTNYQIVEIPTSALSFGVQI